MTALQATIDTASIDVGDRSPSPATPAAPAVSVKT
jgi:hypothetical protein